MTPPRLARALLSMATRPADRAFLLKDLDEELAQLTAERGPSAARRWYWRQAITSMVPLLARRAGAASRLSSQRPAGDDLRQALRWLARHPRTAGAVIATLGLALGAAGAAGAVLYGLAARPLPFPDEARIVHLWTTGPDLASARPSRASIPVVSLQDLDDWRRASRLFSAVSGYVSETYTLTGHGDARRIRAMRVGPDFDRVLGVQVHAGRAFTADEFQPGRERVVVLTHQFWLREFGGDPAAVGRTIMFDEQPYLIAGVLPALSVGFPAEAHDVWVPLIAQPGVFWQHQRGTGWLTAVGRVQADATSDAAAAELTAVAQQLAQTYPASNARRTGVTAEPIRVALLGDSRSVAALIAAAILAVLLVAAANLVNLLLAQSEERRREFSVRRALGAGPALLRRQVGIESLLLAAIGGGVAMGLLPLLVRGFVAAYPAALPAAHLAPGGVVFGALAVLTALAALVLALPQMRHAGRAAMIQIQASNRQTGTRADRRVRSALICAQVAFSIVLMTAGVLLMRTFVRLASVDPGFRSEGVLVFSATPPGSRYGAAGQTTAFHRAALEAVSTIPGVQSAALAIGVPFVSSGWSFPVTPPGRSAEERVMVRVNITSHQYYDVLGIPVLRGRALTEAEQASDAAVAMITESAVALLPDPSAPVGQRVPYSGRQWEIVGVVGDVHQGSLSAAGAPQLILPWSQAGRRPQTMAVRVSSGDPLAVLPAIRARLAEIDPAVPVAEPRRLEDVVSATLSDERFRAVLVAGLAAVALLLAALGVYSVTAYAVATREREHGVRLALGASPAELGRSVVSGALRPAAAGVVLGIAASVAGGRLVSGFLYGVEAGDPWTLGSAAIVLLSVAALAALAPARRAARIDPAALLRAD